MAKLTTAEWKAVREAYEVDCKSSTKLSKEYGIAESTICRRMKKHGWNRVKTQDVIEKSVSATKALAELTQENASLTQAVSREVDRRLRLEGIFMSAIEYNQRKATSLIMHKGDNVELHELNMHSQITARNKDCVMGKPQTQVNIQNNTANETPTMTLDDFYKTNT